MKQRIVYLLAFYLLTVALFAVGKVAFMLLNQDAQTLTFDQVGAVLRHGASLDMSTALYFVIVPFLLGVLSLWLSIPRVLWKGYSLLVGVIISLALVADASLYSFWHFKLDASCLQYLETPGEAVASVSAAYLLGRVALFLLLLSLTVYLFFRLIPRQLHPVRHPWPATLGGLALAPLLVIGIRGGLDESTTNVGQVYFSQNQFLNHSAVNPVFSFFSSFEKTASHIVDYDYYDEEECARLTAGLYPTESVGSDSLLTMSRPDIVIILMESAGDHLSDVMPHLQRLKSEGVSFTNCYANTWRTDRGTVCAYSGYPSFPTSSVMKMPHKTQRLPSIARTLRNAGYETRYFYGGDINFTNMRGYLIDTGFEQLTWKRDFSAGQQASSKWGVRDDIMFDAVFQSLTRPHDRPQLIGFSTLSSHEPWDVPLRQMDDTIRNAFCYLDNCIGRFVARLRQTPQWDRTLLILLPDHSIDLGDITEAHPLRNHIPLVWTGGAVRKPREVTPYCNQTDLAATLLAQLGLAHDDFRWSRDVLSSTYRYPFAVHNYNHGFSVVDSTGFLVYDLDSRRPLVIDSSEPERLERMGKAILQATTEDLKEK